MKAALILLSVSGLILAGCARDEEQSMGAGGAVVGSERSSGAASSYLGEQDQTFLKEAASAGLMEVQMGRLGAQKGQSQAVRQLGQRLVQDHSKANQELKLLASQKNVTLPTEIPTEHQTMLSHLKSLEGAEFDQAFKKHALEHHQEDIQKFEKASQSSPDADVKAFAQKTLPVLQEHLKMAQGIQAAETGQTDDRQSHSQQQQQTDQRESVPPQQP